MKKDNIAIYPNFSSHTEFYEAWYLKLNRPSDNSALWIRFLLLNTPKEKRGDVFAIHFPSKSESPIVTAKLSLPLDEPSLEFATNKDNHIVTIGNCYLSNNQSAGNIQGENHIKWGLSFIANNDFTFQYAPPQLNKIISSRACSPNVNIKVSGTFSVNGINYHCQDVPGSQGHYYGNKYAQQWAWAHCNYFSESGQNTVFEMIDVKVSPIFPSLKSAYIHYKGQDYVINAIAKLFSSRSHYKYGHWQFRCKKDGLVFEIEIEADSNRIIDVSYEDVDYSRLICHNTKLANSKLTVYKNGHQTDQFVSKLTTAFEIVDRP